MKTNNKNLFVTFFLSFALVIAFKSFDQGTPSPNPTKAARGPASLTEVASCDEETIFYPEDESVFDETILFGMTPPLNDNDESYRFSIASGAVSGSRTRILETESSMKNYWMLWGNRCVVPVSDMNVRLKSNDCKTFQNYGKANERAAFNYKPNPWDLHLYDDLDDTRTRVHRYWAFFTSIQKANACTRMQMWAALGREDHARKIGENNGFKPHEIRTSAFHKFHMKAAKRFNVSYPLQRFTPGAQPNSISWPQIGEPYFIDTCIAPNMKPYESRTRQKAQDKIASFLLDYETQDGRTENQTINFVEAIARELHNATKGEKDILMMTNSLNRVFTQRSGITGKSLSEIIRAPGIRGVTLTDYRNARVYNSKRVRAFSHLNRQLKIIEDVSGELPPHLRKKIFVFYGLNNRETKIDFFFDDQDIWQAKFRGARETRQFIRSRGLGGLIVWFEGSRTRRAGETCANPDWQVLQCLTLGNDYCE